jgi:uncharacterized membrane protein (DUF4010 family)
MMANTVSVIRVSVLMVVIGGAACVPLLEPVGVLGGVFAILTALTFWMGRDSHGELPPQGNPTELKAAFLFAFIYTVVKLATAWGRDTFGDAGLYVVGAVSGFTDVDAITLSMSESANHATLSTGLVWRVIVLAVMANLVFKGGCVMVLGNGRLKKWIGSLYLAALAAGGALIFAWPW